MSDCNPCCVDMTTKLSFDAMKSALHDKLAGDKADIEEIIAVLKRYDSDIKDWGKFALSDPYRYTRNLVDEGNGKFNLMILVWNPAQESTIHDHTGSHCFMKNLEGSVQETRFEWPKDGDEKMVQKGEARSFGTDEVFYMSDTLGLHRVGNPSHTDRAVTLHLYSPPFSRCQTFDDDTSKAKTVPMTFYSKYGQKE